MFTNVDAQNTNDPYFQSNGATRHTTRENIALLREKFPGPTISHNVYIKLTDQISQFQLVIHLSLRLPEC